MSKVNYKQASFDNSYTPKDGEFISNVKGDFVFIYDGNGPYKTSINAGFFMSTQELVFGGAAAMNWISYYRPATESEKQALMDALHKQGLEWNEDKKKVHLLAKEKCLDNKIIEP